MKSFSNHLRRLHETTTLGNVNPRTGKPEPGVHEYDAQGNKTRSYSGSSAPSNTPPQPEPNLPKPAPNASSETRFTNPKAEQRFRDELDQRLGNTRPEGDTRPPPKPASQEDSLAARFPEAYPEKEVVDQYDKNPETGEYEKTGSAVKDVDPVMTDPNDPKYNEVLHQPSGEEYAEKLRNWVLDRMDPNSTVAKTLRDFGVSSPGDPPDPTEPEENIPASIDNIEDADEYNKEWDRLEGLLDQRRRSKDAGSFYESTGVLSFRGFLAEAGRLYRFDDQPITPRAQGLGGQRTAPQYISEARSAAWQRSEGKDPEGGLNKKGVASYRRENPGSKLQTAVTTDPKKLKKGSKKAKRRLSFCRRMKGMKKKLTSAKTARDPDSRINKSLRKWNCE
jgi:hypothetical protein